MALARSSFSIPLREKILTLTMIPSIPGRAEQRRVPHVTGLFAEDGAQELLLRRELALPLGRDLAHKDVAGLDGGANPDHAALIQIIKEALRDIGDVAGDLLRPELRVARRDLELFDVDRRIVVVLHQSLGDQDRVFEVVGRAMA